MRNGMSPWIVLAAAGAALAAGSVAKAQQLINVSGSSLLGSFIRGGASTNDFIGVSAQTPPLGTQLASTGGYWSVNYRVSGSINGFDELLNYGYPQFTTAADDRTLGNTTALNSLVLTDEWFNRVQYITNGITGGIYNAANAGGQPKRASTNGADRSVVDGPAGGVTIDVAFLDVPAMWGVKQPGAADPTRKPVQPGYGQNARLSVGLDGSATGGGLSNALTTLGTRNLASDPNRGAAPYDNNTVFEQALTLAPIAPLTNPGTGIQRMKMTELQWLFTTGRARTGENFVVATRDVGSGTRNGFMNGIGIDPSFGVGDNIGVQSNSSNQNLLGPHFYPTNKGATSGLLNTLRNHRLAVGYAGAETGLGSAPSGWLSSNALEIIDTQNDVFGNTSTYVRPTLANILANDASGWVISGQAVVATIGDPLAEPVGMNTATVPNSGGDASGNPAMVNKSAARYVNNIQKSILSFNAVTPPLASVASPGEFLATNFILQAAVANLAPVGNSLARTPNTGFNANAYNFTVANNTTFTNARYAAYNTAIVGLVPIRESGTTYSDGVASGVNYIDQSGTAVSYASPLAARNKIAFDFNGDGVRSLADATDMIAAYRQRNGGGTWTAPDGIYGAGAGNAAVIEVLGDADGNGSFTSADIRYWADGLATNAPGNLDRRQGFIAVDNASLAAGGPLNFFGTVLANPSAAYTPGASRADVIGSSGNVARGWAPVGADGRVDANDIDYVYKQIRAVGIANPWNSASSADWSNISQAEKIDLTADINGDLKVDRHDVEEILAILGTCMGDANLDGVVNQADKDIIMAHLGQTNVGWAGGDLNGDGIVDAQDLHLVCPADFNCDGSVAVNDIFDFLNAWFAGSHRADINGGGLGVNDIFDFLNTWFAGSCN
jgi:hypothetical protein